MALKSKSGQGLVETLLAVTVAVIIITALISLAVVALRNSRQATYTAQATRIAQSQIEYARAFRDISDWATFDQVLTGCPLSTPCHFLDVSGYTSGVKVVAPFSYKIYFICDPTMTCDATNVDSHIIRAKAEVTWSLGGRSQTIYTDTDFTNWRLK
ncbi:hypothetical protein HY419_00780 [candidate division WWE3 bacterium]|nr:hypothetical protein [candidate division WWE3 bacterium]